MANYGGAEGAGSAIRRALLGGVPARPRPGTIAWGGGYLTPQEIVARSNARGAPTTLAQFFTNHPGVAASMGQRQPAAAPAQVRAPEQAQGDLAARLAAVVNPSSVDLASALPPSSLNRASLGRVLRARAARPAYGVGGPAY